MDSQNIHHVTFRVGGMILEFTDVDFEALMANIIDVMAAGGGEWDEMLATVICLRGGGHGTMDPRGFEQIMNILANLVHAARFRKSTCGDSFLDQIDDL